MYDNQQFSPPESEEDKSAPRRRRGISRLLWVFLALVVVLVAAAATAIVLGRDGDRQTVGEASRVVVGAAGGATEVPTERLPKEPVREESEVVDAAPTVSAGPQAQESLEQTPPEPAEPTAEPTITPTSEPTMEPTAEPTATEPAESDVPARLGAGRIAVVDNRSQLWTVASDGSERRLLTEPGRFYQFPSWSPAGNDIAVIGNDSDGGGVYVVADAQDSEVRQLYSDRLLQPNYLYWSPEGENVSFIANHADGMALHLAPSDGDATPQLVTTSPSTFFWDWMPDSSQVLVHTGFTARTNDTSRLAFVPLDEIGAPEEIIQNGFFQAPVLAADGRFFSYGTVSPDGNRWLSVYDIVQDQQVELILHQGVLAMGFSPTRPQLAYISPNIQERSFYGPLRLVDLESEVSRELVPETVLAFFWSPDGRSIAYLTLSAIERPYEFDDSSVAGLFGRELPGSLADLPDAAKGKLLAKVQSPPDEEARIGLGISIVDVDSGDTRLLTVFEPSTVFLNRFLPFFDQYALSHRLWSPDSQALVLPMTDEQDRDFIVVVPVDGSEPLPITRGVAAFWSRQ